MRRSTGFGLGLIAALALTACGQGQVAIVVELEGEDGGDARLLEDIEVRLVPYDRDRVFDSLTTAAPMPEPVIPEDLMAARDDIAEAQRAWTEADSRLGVLRDTINKLNTRLQSLNRGMNEYRDLFRQVDPMITEAERLEGTVESLFQTFDGLQKANLERLRAVEIERENWADQAFMDVPDVFAALTEISGLEQHWDTTGADGSAVVEVAPGQYWVYARYELLYDELYWNVPVAVERGDPVVVRLTRANATVRPIY